MDSGDVDVVTESFRAFVDERFERYGIGKRFYPDGPRPGDQHGQNPYLKTEADVQVKFGGFLEQWLLDRHPELTVHAELPLYSGPSERADLSIHRVAAGEAWTTRQEVLGALVSVIEIKLANVRHPLFDFERGGIQKDVRLLRSLPPGIGRYLLVVDEAESIARGRVEGFLSEARSHGVRVVSNNRHLTGAP